MKFLNKKYTPQYIFLLILIMSPCYQSLYDIKPLFYALYFILLILLSIFLKIFIEKISDKANMEALKKNQKSCIQLGLCFTFLSLYPVLHFYVKNYVSLDVHYFFIGIFTVLLGISIFTIICFIILRNFCISFYLSSALGIMFYFINYKNINNLGIFLIIALIVCILCFLYKRGTEKPFKNMVIIASAILGIFVCFDFISSVLTTGGGILNSFKNINSVSIKNKKTVSSNMERDIYILMLDMYPGSKALEKFTGFDNSDFTNELRKRGFYVFDDIYSNYNKTAISIPSMLNMDYPENAGHKNRWDAVNNALIFKLAKESGRKNIYFNHSAFFRLIKPTDTKIISIISIKFYENELKNTYNNSLIYTICHNYIWDKIKIGENAELKPFLVLKNSVVSDNSKKFVFAHIMMPHPPYLFDENGKKRTNTHEIYEGWEKSKLAVNKESFISYLKYTNKEALDFIDYAIKHSDKPPVILITGDHGIRANEYKNWKEHINEAMANKFEIYLNFATFAAYYNPDDDKKRIKKAKSIVNLYRLFSNEMFNTKYDMLPDKHTIFFCRTDCSDTLKYVDKLKTYSNKEIESFK